MSRPDGMAGWQASDQRKKKSLNKINEAPFCTAMRKALISQVLGLPN